MHFKFNFNYQNFNCYRKILIFISFLTHNWKKMMMIKKIFTALFKV